VRPMRRTGLLVALAALATPAPLPAAAPGARPVPPHQADFFERHVRPVFLANCVECHGPDKQRGGLRLDSRAGLLKGGKRGPVVKPGDPDGSRLIQAIRHAGKLKMPPKRKLNPDAVADLTAWVKGGAPWPSVRAAGEAGGARHWAFLPVANPAPPAVKDNAWPRTSLDRFILAKLEARGLKPSPEADRRTLVRRLSFDLTGLPPTPEEVDAFLNDRRPGAYERLVDRLLASPRYGERWGRFWLDVARFADTKGYVFFEESAFPWAYTYRDYVIGAFNADLPYDRFLLEQLAADQLPLGKDRRPLRAMGFLTLGGRFMNNPHDILDDRIDVVTRGLLGLTVSCARCHDHKYDPIPTKDYYSLYGVFAGSVEPSLPPLFEDPPATPQYATFRKELDKRERALNTFIRTKQAEVFNGARTRVAEYLLAAHARRGQPSAEDFMLLTDGGELNPAMLNRWQAFLERAGRKHHRVFAPWHAFAALPEKEFAAKAKNLAARLASGSGGDGPVNPLVAKAFAGKPPKSLADVAARYGEVLNATEKMWQEELAKAARAKLPPPARLDDPDREELRKVFHGPDAPPDVPEGLIADLDLLPDRPAQDKLQKLRKAVEQWRATGPGAPPRAMVLVDSPRPYEPRVFRRGNPNNPGPAVPRQFLGVLSGPNRKPFTHGSGRLELAQAIASKDNPLTARVLVNRVWLHHFGAGLVRTPGDFGTRSDPPSHPELLDHLATLFMESGWSVKKLHRLIVTSAVYRQVSVDRPGCRQVDPENLLLWRMNRRRLDFEATRDALLAVSGRLGSAVGGPSVKDIVSPSSTRRTLYGFVDRLHVPGLYRTFDFPSPDATSPQRDNTTVPQQALFLMNSPFVLESARGLLRRAEPAKDLEARVGLLYRLCYGRAPAADELALARAFLPGGKGAPGDWERYAQALLLANEFAFVD
jgi:mono/diheme cytochrome c family protein